MICILTLDIGTTSVKTCLFDDKLNLLDYSNIEYELIARDGLIELCPDTYWLAVKNGINTVLKGRGQDVVAITATTQGETLIPVGKDGGYLRNAIVWLDGRAEKEALAIKEHFDDATFYRKTGLPEVDGCCPVSKLLWIKNNQPAVYDETYRFLLLEDYIIAKLTGEYVTEAALATSTGYYDINSDEYWLELLETIGLDADKLPKVLGSGTVVSRIRPDVADELGISRDARVTTGAMDQLAGAVGAGNVIPGVVTETTGTALVIGATTDKPDYNHPAKAIIYRHVRPGNYLIIPICMTAGIVLKWFKDEFCKLETAQCEKEGTSVYDVLGDMAASVPPLSEGLLLFPHFTGMLMPQRDLNAKGVFFGVGLDTKMPHFVRAIFEAVAYMLRENIKVIEELGVDAKRILSLGGGSKSPVWLQIKADVLGKEIVNMDKAEAASLGAAILGGVAVGIFESLEQGFEIGNAIRRSFKPNQEVVQQYQKGFIRYKQLYEHIKPMFRESQTNMK